MIMPVPAPRPIWPKEPWISVLMSTTAGSTRSAMACTSRLVAACPFDDPPIAAEDPWSRVSPHPRPAPAPNSKSATRMAATMRPCRRGRAGGAPGGCGSEKEGGGGGGGQPLIGEGSGGSGKVGCSSAGRSSIPPLSSSGIEGLLGCGYPTMVLPMPEGAVGGTSGSPVNLSLPALHAFPRVVVDLEGFLLRAFPLRHVPQVEADPRPRRASAAHRVHQHVGRPEVRPCLGMPPLPALQPLPGLGLGRCPGHLDERHRRPPPPRRPGPLARRRRGDDALALGLPARFAPLRGLDPRWLAGLLGEVGRPRRVAEPGLLVLSRQLEQPFQRIARLVHRLEGVADLGEPLGDGVD